MNNNENNIDKKALIDPFMQEESPEAMAEKKAKWLDIFNQFPEFSDAVISVYDKRTEKNFGEFLVICTDIANLL